MSDRAAHVEVDGDVTLVSLELDVDFESEQAIVSAVSSALVLERPVLVDMSDCTFLELRALRALSDAYHQARAHHLPFVVVLPFDGAPLVRRLMLELVCELAPFPIAPTRVDARRRLAARPTGPESAQLSSLRRRLWEHGAATKKLLARRDELILEQRRALAEL